MKITGNRFFDFRELKQILKREKLVQADQHPDDEHDDPDDETRHDDPERIERREKFVAGENCVVA